MAGIQIARRSRPSLDGASLPHDDARIRKPACRRVTRGARLLRFGWALTLTVAGGLAAAVPARAAADAADLFELSIEELGRVRVTSAARRSEPLQRVTSAMYVITAEDIRRSGLNRLPEILRLAPGVEVARTGTHSWSISIRGFNSDLSNKLLVLIDGRSVYSPLFAGGFWDAQDVLVQDIERIEVISGPGGTLWGANAVNGVINIITRPARETQGSMVEVAAGSETRRFAGLRHGWQAGADFAARAWVKYAESDASLEQTGEPGVDDARRGQAGFRVDWERSENDRLVFQGDAYAAELGDWLRPEFALGTLPGPDRPGTVDIGGFNLLTRWDRNLETGGHVLLQAYLDHTARDAPGTFDERRHTLDVDFQHDVAPAGRHRVIWGAGVRVTSDELDNTTFASFIPDSRRDETLSLFVQDDITLLEDELVLTAGTKLEHNDYSGWEAQPNLRLGWALADDRFLWAAVSRAVRIPARLDSDLELVAPLVVPGMPVPVYFNARGSESFRSEELIATEAGYRAQLGPDLSIDVSLFRHDYDRLQTQEPGAISVVGDPPRYLLIPATLANGMRGEARGGTLVTNWQVLEPWRLQLQYAYLDLDLELIPGSSGAGSLALSGNSPTHQATLHSFLELPQQFELFTSIRHVDELPGLGVPGYTAVDLSLGWNPLDDLRLSLTVRNLTDGEHLEFGGGNLIERSALLRAVWTF